ncbi:hypothetical protein FOQG_12853 [Fusarium oxysporum f. sp. raphani 54005]|uniref:Uncharacterized protein n=5 Tax=Fusarium oxysporum TaxID=5507 RepID=X0BVF2_FUSOX|nr:hypothetical protein FOXB_02951 [Fusarium oxysporum f. sp. conglutinans Fo5176]EXK82893.1 hypothetical protein FOQG_12853 [Fusarium oxysporum f. sp. raphani 54005]EXL73361.1 hypothetical protein FOPG_11295 [Fusarium oxysporum f. sp. conglutinans race 2 54008]KAF6527401.1 hypothetical protein HZS61_010445 [Fusarium oxysporum f. sp. conglutinans]KAG7435670.1 hypothetical protein Forpi1262_v003614 [Fusarium oxysporum f. sp. raphani]KAI8415811.1 hypothetical protein FOFC_05438 [Fusarium oxyspor
MSFTFNGVKKDGNGAYYYNDGDVESHRIPLSDQCYGDVRMSREQLEEWFGISNDTLPDLPAYYILPRLDSTWGGTAGGGWWNVTGDIVVYKPIEWVPSVARIRDFPKNSIVTNIEKERVETTTTKLYAKAEFALEVSAGGNYMGIKAEAKAKTETGVEFEKEVRNKDTYTQKGVVGDVALVEVAVGLMLRVEEIYTHNIKVWVDGREKGDSLGWHGGPSWNDIHIPSRSLSRVGGLQFSKITMTGGGHSAGLYVQTLPVFDEKKELKDLHIALSNVGWTDWYAYVAGKKGRSSGRQLLAYPNYRPSTTLMPLNKTPAKTE